MPRMQPDYNEEELEFAGRLSDRVTQHPPLDVLTALDQDVLPPDVEAAAAAHLKTCPLCQMLVADLGEIEASPLSQREREKIAATLPLKAKSSNKGMQRWGLAVAAAIVCAVGLTLWKTHEDHKRQDIAVAVVPAPPVVARLEIPALPISPLAPPTDTTLSTRGIGSVEPSTELLLPAFRFYNAHDYVHAEAGFKQLERQYPRSALVRLYLGVTQVMLHENESARATLSSIDKGAHAADAAEWYKAVAMSQEHSSETEALLRSICNRRDSAYSSQACAVLP